MMQDPIDLSAGLVAEPRRQRRGVTRFDAPDWKLSQLSEIESEYQKETGQPLPVRNRGQGSIHNRWGYQHQNAADIGLHPSSSEGQALMRRLRDRNIPFLAFDRAIPGVATGPHIHIGRPSQRTGQRERPQQDELDLSAGLVEDDLSAGLEQPQQRAPSPALSPQPTQGIFSSTRLTKPPVAPPRSFRLPSFGPPVDEQTRRAIEEGVQVAETRRPTPRSPAAQAKPQTVPSFFDPTIPKVSDWLSEVSRESQAPRTFGEDRAMRTAATGARDALLQKARQQGVKVNAIRQQVAAEMSRPETYSDQYGTRQRMSTPDPQIVEAETLRRAQAALAEKERQARVAQMSTGQRAAQRAAQIPKSLITGFTGAGGDVLKSVAIASRKLVDQVTDTRGLDTRDTHFYQLGDYIQKRVPEILRSNPDLEQEFFIGKAPSAVGQSLQFLLGGAVTKSPKLAVTLLGGGMTAADAYDEIRSLGGSDDEAVNWGLLAGATLGPTELLGTRGLLKTIAGTPAEATLKAALKTALREGRRDAIENALQEIGQEYLQGHFTGRRRTFNELLEAAALGAIVGAGTAPVTAGSQYLKRRTQGANVDPNARIPPAGDPARTTAPPPITPPAASSGPTAETGSPTPAPEPIAAIEENRRRISSDEFRNHLSTESVGGNAGENRAAVNMLVDDTGRIVFIGNFQDAPGGMPDQHRTGQLKNVSAIVHWPEGMLGKSPPVIERVIGPEPARSIVEEGIPREWGGPPNKRGQPGRSLAGVPNAADSVPLATDKATWHVDFEDPSRSHGNIPPEIKRIAEARESLRAPTETTGAEQHISKKASPVNIPTAPSRAGDRLVTGERADLSLSQFVRKNGGIAPADAYRGELDRLRLRESGTTGLINRKAKQGNVDQTADILMQSANDAGFRDPRTGQPFENPGDFLYAVERDVAGEKIYSTLRDDAMADEEFTRREAAYYAEQEARERAEVGRVELLEGGRGADLFDRIRDGKASNAERQEFSTLATGLGLSQSEIEDLITGDTGEAEGVEAPSSARRAETRSAQQLGFVPEGLQQQVAPPPKVPDQRERLIREQHERDEAADPERAAATRELAEIHRRGMTVDDYARQGSLLGDRPAPERLRLLRELESEARSTSRTPDADLAAGLLFGEDESTPAQDQRRGRYAVNKAVEDFRDEKEAAGTLENARHIADVYDDAGRLRYHVVFGNDGKGSVVANVAPESSESPFTTEYIDARAGADQYLNDLDERGDNVRRVASSRPTAARTEAFEERIGQRPSKSRDIFSMDDGDLADLLDEEFGSETSAAGHATRRTSVFTFPNYAEFEKWMDARFDEADLEGMQLAFKDAPRAHKVAYIKANAKADPIKKAWVAHLVTLSPLPGEKPPVTRTTPRPMPGGATAGPGTPPQPRPRTPSSTPPPPPTPPRAATGYPKFDIMALVQLFRQFENYPVVNQRLVSAYGRFIPEGQILQIKERLLWDTKLAQRVLGHEIGHFIDLIIEKIGKGQQFASRLKPLYSFKGKIAERQDLRNEARNLSRAWRGPFSNGDSYRDKASELFADFMSAMLTNPEWVNQNHRKLHDAFVDLQKGKPEFAKAYSELESWLQGDRLVDEWMDQQHGAVKRTVNDLMKDRPRLRERFRDWLKGAFVTTWHRAFEKEGRPAEIGQSISDELEYSNSWAAKENALFADDFQQKVEPELKKVDSDLLKARSLLHSYSQARRTIGERRAAGVWIENNPTDARTMLYAVLNLSPALSSKFHSQLTSATDTELYDLAAEIFREAHDLGEGDVKRLAKEIDAMDLGVRGNAALQAFNVRGKLLNPGGLTTQQAEAVLDKIKKQLTPAQWTALETAGKNLRDLFFNVQRAAFAEGLISDRIWTELIEPNKDNYLPYAVLDYWDGRVRGGVMPQKGTAKDIADVTLAAQLKVGSLNVWRQKQRQVQLLRQVYEAGGLPIPVGQRLRRASDIDQIRKRHPEDDISRAVVWADGSPYLVEFPGDPGKTLEKAMDSASFYQHMEWFSDAGRITHGIMQLYTTLSIPFLVYRNPVRGARTAALRMGFGRTGQQLLSPGNLAESLSLARNYADAAFGAPIKPELRELIDRQVVLPPRLSAAMVRDAANLRDLLETGGVLATQLRTLKGREWSVWKGGAPTRRAFQFAEKVFAGYEAFEKIYNYKAALAKGKSKQSATQLGRRAGIPKPGVGGHLSFPMEVFFPWTRVHIQGTRATIDMLRDPTMRKGFVTRFVMSEGAPRVMKVLVGAGVLSGALPWLVRDDEDKKDPVMSEVMRRVSPYKMALDDIVPLMLYDAHEGKYYYFNQFKSGAEIPAHFEVVSYRIPASEEGRMWGVLLYNTMISVPGFNEKMSRPGTDIFSNLGQWAFNYALPGISPAIETSSALTDMIVMGKNPEDPFRGGPAANEQLFEAGGVERAHAIAGYALNQAGGPGEIAAVAAMNFGLLDKRAGESLKRRLAADKTPLPERLPLARSMFSYDNYGRYREEKSAVLAEERLRARARLVMSDDARQLYDYYYRNVKRADSLTGLEQQRFEASKRFVHKIWGDMNTEGSFYAAAAHAVSDDGSKQAKETVKRDMDQAAAPLLAVFKGDTAIPIKPKAPPKPLAPRKPTSPLDLLKPAER